MSKNHFSEPSLQILNNRIFLSTCIYFTLTPLHKENIDKGVINIYGWGEGQIGRHGFQVKEIDGGIPVDVFRVGFRVGARAEI